MARSIIIEDIKPTHWRLRLRDGAGKSREVDFKSGTPLRLDMSEKVAAIDSAAKKSHKPSKPEARAKAKDTARTPDKGRKSEEVAEEEKPKATRSESDAATPKPASEPASKPRRRKPEPGAGPGELVWEENEDDGVPGLRASFERGAFKILEAGGDVFALFYEWNNGKYQTLACGSLEALKESAAQWQGDNKLQAPRSNLGAEAAKVACAKPEESPATVPQPAAPVIEPEKDKAIMEGFEATLQKMMAARAAAKEGT
jgi:hypothetical protein